MYCLEVTKHQILIVITLLRLFRYDSITGKLLQFSPDRVETWRRVRLCGGTVHVILRLQYTKF